MGNGRKLIGILEDDADGRDPLMRKVLAEQAAGVEVVIFDNAPDFGAWLRAEFDRVALLSLDHDLGPNRTRDGETFDPGSGMDVIEYLESREPSFPVIVHSSNGPYAQVMVVRLEVKKWKVERVVPFMDQWIAEVWIRKVVEFLESMRT